MGTAVSLTLVGHLTQRFLGGRFFSAASWLAVWGLSGLSVGSGSGVLAFIFMALKTGLHGHGPEFQSAEIEWVLGMIPLWGVAGLVAGLGLGVLVWGVIKE
jgi:hypothetical protein